MATTTTYSPSPPRSSLALLFFWIYIFFLPSATSTSELHIVYLGMVPGSNDPLLTTQSHIQLISNVFSSKEEAKEAMVYSYKNSFSGFAALLNSSQASTLSSTEGVMSVFRSRIMEPHTTRSWDFLGLNVDYRRIKQELEEEVPLMEAAAAYGCGHDVVVGMFDTGIWPESESFREHPEIGPVPGYWKGMCVSGESFDGFKACNRKLIGARYYIDGFEREFGRLNATAGSGGGGEYRSPRDRIGHGTHTASIAVGGLVGDVSFFGLGGGTARGGAPLARLAVYKVCWLKDRQGRCTEADILAAYDDALKDGVNVISCSLGSPPPLMPIFSTSTGIGSFHATLMGVSVVFSAGNKGPKMSMVENVSPWGICVAATTIDRSFPTEILLGNNVSVMGESFVDRKMEMSLVDSRHYFDDGACKFQNWKGQMLPPDTAVLCFATVGSVSSLAAALMVSAIKGSAVIFSEELTRTAAHDDLLPSIHIDIFQGTQILHYIQSSNSHWPTVTIFPTRTVVGKSPAPAAAYFSSRGPSTLLPGILKPDIAAPGVGILAAWPPTTPPTTLPPIIDPRSVRWNFLSGTSMSCPHVTGLVALLKSVHPDWSPAAIKSALMTTALTRDATGDTILAQGTMHGSTPFDVGAGSINPNEAFDPGLVYDVDNKDYFRRYATDGGTADLNYPSITITELGLGATVRVKRTVRNVCRRGGGEAVEYRASVVSPDGVRVTVRPRRLVFFGSEGEAVDYYVTFRAVKWSSRRFDFGEIVWSDGFHRVRSPLVVRVTCRLEKKPRHL